MSKRPTYEALERRIKGLEKEAAAHQKAEKEKEHVLDGLLEHIIHEDRDMKILWANRAACESAGLRREDLIGRYCYEIWPQRSDPCPDCPVIKSMESGLPQKMEKVTPDGRAWLINGYPIFDDKGEIKGGIEITLEMTDKKRTEEALRESENRYRQLVKYAPAGITEIDIKKNRFISVNNVTCEYTGYTREELLAMEPLDIFSEDSKALFLKRLSKASAGEQIPETVEYKIKKKDGREIYALTSVRVTLDEKGKPVKTTGVSYDITEHKQAEAALHREQEKFRVLVEESPLGVSLIGEDGHHKYLNPKFIDIFGYTLDDIPTEKEWFERAYPDQKYRNQVVSIWVKDQKESKVGEIRPRTFNVKCKDGSEKIISVKSAVMKTGDRLVFCEDITDKRRLEAQFQQAQRMEAIGTLAGGIAHNFNNILMVIQGRTSLMLLDKDSSHPDFKHLKSIENYVDDAADLTKKLLGFARSGKYEVQSADLNDLVKKSSKMFGRTKKEIKIHTKYQEDIWSVEIDQSQIEQALMNLYVNAWQAMPGGGDLFIQTENVSFGEDYTRAYQVEPGKYVRISVTDSGIGMDEETRNRIFEPFFTTKEMGKGTGLGLASAYGIVKNHNGFINVYSEKGEGTTFNIYLPASEKGAIKEKKLPEEVLKGEETVLLVDDEEMIIDVGRQLLERLGYKVLAAKNGKQAIDIYKENKENIKIVILDMIMPDMGGGETYDRLKDVNPEIKVLLSSGYSINGQATEILNRGCNSFIQKPFNIKDLSHKLRGILEETPL